MSARPWKIAAGLALMLAGCGGESPAPVKTGAETSSTAAPVENERSSTAKAEKETSVAAAPASSPVVEPAKPVEPVGDPVNPLAAVAAEFQAGKTDSAIAKAEAMLKEKPEDRDILLLITQMTQARGANLATNGDRKGGSTLFYKSADFARQLAKVAKDFTPLEKQTLSMALYNEACSLAIEEKTEPAINALREAIAMGFDEKATFAQDPELDSLRKLPEFADLAEKMGIESSKAKVARLLEENKPFPISFKLTDFQGNPVSTEDLKGKVAIIDFWGTWCPPCREELPVLAALYEKYKDQGFDIVGVNCNEGSGPEVNEGIKKFLAAKNVPYRCVLSDEKVENQIPDLEGYPTTLFLDRTGTVRLKLVGFDPAEKDVLEETVKTLLDEKK